MAQPGASGGLAGALKIKNKPDKQPTPVSPIRPDFVSPIRPTAQGVALASTADDEGNPADEKRHRKTQHG